MSDDKNRLQEIIRSKSVRRGEFTLASGEKSDFYLDMKPTAFDPEGATLIGRAVFDLIKDEADIDAVGGLELGAVPIVTSVAQSSWPTRPITAFVVRKAKKDHGTAQAIDGNFTDGMTVVLIDDVTTKGGSVMQAVHAVRARGGTVKRIVSIVDRGEGAAQNLQAEGIALQALFTKADFI
jgi:orotate phosphoribosyltransferase